MPFKGWLHLIFIAFTLARDFSFWNGSISCNILKFAGEFLNVPDVYIRIGRYLLSGMGRQGYSLSLPYNWVLFGIAKGG